MFCSISLLYDCWWKKIKYSAKNLPIGQIAESERENREYFDLGLILSMNFAGLGTGTEKKSHPHFTHHILPSRPQQQTTQMCILNCVPQQTTASIKILVFLPKSLFDKFPLIK
jgi:hypothetical protein